MNAEKFIQELEQVFDKTLKAQQTPLYLDKLRRFSPEQLVELLNKVLEEAKYFPKVSEIFKAANELGYLSVDTNTVRPHRWKISDCRMCHGEGRLCVTWISTSEIRNDERREVQALSKILPYVASCDSDQFRLQDGEYRSLWRCSCMAGDAPTLPKAWPKWSRNVAPVRYV